MQFVSYDSRHDEITVLRRGVEIVTDLAPFIGTGQVDLMSRSDQARLFVLLKNHPHIVADRGAFGSYSFSLMNRQNMLLVLGLFYLALLVLCPVMFIRHFHFMGMEITAATVLFPLTYFVLDCISELYGFRRARQVLVYLGLSLLLTDTINIFLFHRLRSWMNNRWFAVRSAVSTTVALGLFSLVASVTRYQDYWNDPETLHFVIDITLMKLVLVPLYLPHRCRDSSGCPVLAEAICAVTVLRKTMHNSQWISCWQLVFILSVVRYNPLQYMPAGLLSPVSVIRNLCGKDCG